MQVISGRSCSSSNSTPRTQRKGLSVTSKNKCNSLPRPEKYSTSEETLQTDGFAVPKTQLSIKFNNGSEIDWLNHSQTQTKRSISMSKNIAQMPKITFRYTNEPLANYQPSNLFIAQNNGPNSTSINRGRIMTSQEFRNVVISQSIETKNLSQSKVVPQNLIKQANPTKQLIDSRRIDRQIIEEKVYQVLPPKNHKSISFNTLHQQQTSNRSCIPLISHDSSQTSFSQHPSTQTHPKPQATQQNNLSPYHLLISSAKRCESKEVSPSVLKQLKEYPSLQLMSLEKIPQVQEFNINGNGQESVDCVEDYREHNESDKILMEISSRNEQIEREQIEIRISGPFSNSCLTAIQNETTHQESALTSKDFNVTLSPNKKLLKKSPSRSPEKKTSNKHSEQVISQIENRPPEAQHTISVGGKRNFRRIREIQKRLEEIINICSDNL